MSSRERRGCGESETREGTVASGHYKPKQEEQDYGTRAGHHDASCEPEDEAGKIAYQGCTHSCTHAGKDCERSEEKADHAWCETESGEHEACHKAYCSHLKEGASNEGSRCEEGDYDDYQQPHEEDCRAY